MKLTRFALAIAAVLMCSSCGSAEFAKSDSPESLKDVGQIVKDEKPDSWFEFGNKHDFVDREGYGASSKWDALGEYLTWRKKDLSFLNSSTSMFKRDNWYRFEFSESTHKMSLFIELIDDQINDIRWFDNFDNKYQEVHFFETEQDWISSVGFDVGSAWQVGEKGCFSGAFEPRVLGNATTLIYDMNLLAIMSGGEIIRPTRGTSPEMFSGGPSSFNISTVKYWPFTACYSTQLTEVKHIEVSPSSLKFESDGKWLTYTEPLKIDLGLVQIGENVVYPEWFAKIEPLAISNGDDRRSSSTTSSSTSSSSSSSTTTIVESADWITKNAGDFFVAPYAQTVCDTLESWKAPSETSAKEVTDFKSLLSAMKKMMGDPSDRLWSDTYLKIYSLGHAALEYETQHPNDRYKSYSVSAELHKTECLAFNFVYRNSKFGMTSDGSKFKYEK